MVKHKPVECVQGTAIEIIKEKVEDIHKSLKGNGRPGLLDDHKKLEEKVIMIDTEIKTNKENFNKYFGSGVLIAIIMVILQAMMFWIMFTGGK